MIQKNPNALLEGMRAEIGYAALVCMAVYGQFSEDFFITYTSAGKHMEGSLHFKNRAFDCLPPDQNKAVILMWIRGLLGADYDVLDEGDHVHVEHDPK